MALDDPEPIIGVHLTNLEISPYRGAGAAPLTTAESSYVADVERWDASERGYSAIQSTKPQTVGYGLNDSPAGQAAWILERSGDRGPTPMAISKAGCPRLPVDDVDDLLGDSDDHSVNARLLGQPVVPERDRPG